MTMCSPAISPAVRLPNELLHEMVQCMPMSWFHEAQRQQFGIGIPLGIYLEEARVKFMEMNGEVVQISSEVKESRRRLLSNIAEFERLHSEKDAALEKQLQEKDAQMAEMRKEKEKCEDELKVYKSATIERDQLRVDNAKLVNDANQGNAEIKRYQQQLFKTYMEKDQLRETLKQQRDENAKLKQRLDKLQERYDSCQQSCGFLEEDLKEAQTVGQELRRELDATNKKCAIVENQAKYATEELRRLQGSHNSGFVSTSARELSNGTNNNKCQDDIGNSKGSTSSTGKSTHRHKYV